MPSASRPPPPFPQLMPSHQLRADCPVPLSLECTTSQGRQRLHFWAELVKGTRDSCCRSKLYPEDGPRIACDQAAAGRRVQVGTAWEGHEGAQSDSSVVPSGHQAPAPPLCGLHLSVTAPQTYTQRPSVELGGGAEPRSRQRGHGDGHRSYGAETAGHTRQQGWPSE